MKYVIDLKKITKKDTAIAGGKGASLGEMIKAGFPIPPGFVILSDAFDKFYGSAFPKELAKEILAEFKKLKSKYVAVRSSATAEDSASAAWAGQLESYLNTTEKNLIENVKKCWKSLYSPRAISYRTQKKLSKKKISVAVVVQKMIASEVSGVAFSVHPVTEDKNQMIIEAVFGLGEALVSGKVTPDSYVIEKDSLKLLDINKQGRQKLLEKQIKELAKLVGEIENHYGFPVDVEWARAGGKFYILQSRPITTL